MIYGRNVWQREWTEALEIVEQIKEIMLSSVSRIPVSPAVPCVDPALSAGFPARRPGSRLP